MSTPVLLGGYAAKQCPRVVHNRFDGTIEDPDWAPDPDLQELFDAGIDHEAATFGRLAEALGSAFVDLTVHDSPTARMQATLEAIDRGVLVIAGGQLPADLRGHRVGKPDLLLRWTPPGARALYVPGDVKLHVLAGRAKTKSATVSPLGDPVTLRAVSGATVRPSGSFNDAIQLAHYTRMLQAIDRHPGPDALVGAILGSDDLSDLGINGPALVWLPLDKPVFKTFSRSRGSKKRTALERYDYEHSFRVLVAERAALRHGHASDPAPLVRPIYQAECDTCRWWQRCRPLIADDDPSWAIESGRLDIRELNALRRLDVDTTTALAQVDVGDHQWLQSYLPEVTHWGDQMAIKRLDLAVQRSQMLENGTHLKRTSAGKLSVPHADIEIDLDMENDTNGYVYLWGARTRDGQDDDTATYRAFFNRDRMTEQHEIDLAASLLHWLRTEIAAAAVGGKTVAVYHHSPVEPARLRKILGETATTDVLDVFVDLHQWLTNHFLGRAGLGLKQVATALGFCWRDHDPGGRQSQQWLDQAHHGGPGAKELYDRVLRYNEDDVKATAWIRDHIRQVAQ